MWWGESCFFFFFILKCDSSSDVISMYKQLFSPWRTTLHLWSPQVKVNLILSYHDFFFLHCNTKSTVCTVQKTKKKQKKKTNMPWTVKGITKCKSEPTMQPCKICPNIPWQWVTCQQKKKAAQLNSSNPDHLITRWKLSLQDNCPSGPSETLTELMCTTVQINRDELQQSPVPSPQGLGL